MSEPQTTSDESEKQPKPLPRNAEVLSRLLRAIESELGFLERGHHAQKIRLEELQKALTRPQHIVDVRPLLKAVNEASFENFAKGSGHSEMVRPYLPCVEFDRATKEFLAAVTRLGKMPHPPREPLEIDLWRPIIEAFAEVVAAEEVVLGLFRKLQQDVIAALEAEEPTGADKNPDKRQSGRVKLPRNKDVFRLAKKINDEIHAELSQRQIAIAFTNGDEGKADNLLRQLRRYPHLLHHPDS
jgi:hypothetical protein